MSKNIKEFKAITATVTVLLFAANCNAQFFVRGGYNIGFTNPREINRVIYVHNQINNDYYATGNDLNLIKTLGGIHISMGSEDEGTGWELSWSNKHDVVKSEFLYQGETINRYMKVRSNTLGIGFFGGSKNISFGCSLDFGNMKGFYKRAPADSIKEKEYVSLFQNQDFSEKSTNDLLRTTQVGFTPFVQVKAGPVGVRLYYQWQFMRLALDNIDNKLLGADIEEYQNLEDKLSNFGVTVFLQLGGSN